MRRLTGWYRNRRRRTRAVLAALALVICLGGVYYGVREVALRNADHLTITVTPDAQGHQAPIYRHTFGPSLTAEAEHLLNNVATPISDFSDLPDNLTGYSGPLWHYHLAFTWHGVLIETADMLYDGLFEIYTISALGLPEPHKRTATSSSDRYPIITSLILDSGFSIPLPPTAQLGG
ncbi:MAG TPA: hypothetical protein VJN88_11755 [Ktedonobacterales bacterium]|nr:hypothetical protein [Ktedonobacterales bacterium]